MTNGYYQEVDDARDSYQESKTNFQENRRLGHVGDARYENISHLSGRAFCNARHKINQEGEMKFEHEKAEWEKTARAGYGFFRCKNCKCGFEARLADRKRGWGKYCSKSCKAQCH